MTEERGRVDRLWDAALNCRTWQEAGDLIMQAQAAAAAVQAARMTLVAQGQTAVALLILGTTDVTVTWPAPFPDDTYTVDVIPMDLVGKATWSVTGQSAADVTVHLAAIIALAVGTRFLVVGRS